MKTDTVTTNGVEMEFFAFGKGERSFVILPGIDVKSVLTAAKAVENAYKIFAEDYTVYVFDRRKNLPKQYPIAQMADDTAAVLQALGIRDADVFGASQGGMIAMRLAAKHPELVHALALGSTAAYCTDTIRATCGTWIDCAKAGDITGLTADFIDRLYSANTIRQYRDFLMHMNDHVGAEGMRRFIILAQAIADFDMRDELKNITCPTLVIGAENDLALGAQPSREIAETLGCELYLYGSEYGHCVFDEAPDYKQRLLDFFRKYR